MAKGKGKRKIGAGDVASNRYASHRYELLERLECGIVLEGTEGKALRASGAQLKDGYAAVSDDELWLHSIHIPPSQPVPQSAGSRSCRPGSISRAPTPRSRLRWPAARISTTSASRCARRRPSG